MMAKPAHDDDDNAHGCIGGCSLHGGHVGDVKPFRVAGKAKDRIYGPVWAVLRCCERHREYLVSEGYEVTTEGDQ